MVATNARSKLVRNLSAILLRITLVHIGSIRFLVDVTGVFVRPRAYLPVDAPEMPAPRTRQRKARQGNPHRLALRRKVRANQVQGIVLGTLARAKR